MTIKKRQKKLLNILVTAGPTREPIDAVRFISNYSTGFFGYEIAREARRRGHRVILVSGPVALSKPKGVTTINVETCRQMQERLEEKFDWCDCLLMTAAMCDFRPRKVAKSKIKRNRYRRLTLELRQNPDILAGLAFRKGRRMVAGFALETENLQKNARQKLVQKNLDLIVATQIKAGSYPFGKAALNVLIMDRKKHIQRIEKTTKTHLSRILLDSIEKNMLI